MQLSSLWVILHEVHCLPLSQDLSETPILRDWIQVVAHLDPPKFALRSILVELYMVSDF